MHITRKQIRRSLGINRVIMMLTASDVFTWGAFYVISSLAGLYLADKLGGDVVKYVGIGTSIYFVSRAIFQFPVAYITDKLRSDKDEIFILFVGSVLMGVPYLLYPQIQNEYHYYLLQFVFGMGSSMNLNTWRKLFARNVEHNHEGGAYGFYEVIMSISSAALIALGGTIANASQFYFDMVIVSVGVVMMLGGIWGALIYFVQDRKG